MPTEVDFIRAVIARPDDDAPRLIYADWLDEQGQGERAEFIRVQCELADGGLTDKARRQPRPSHVSELNWRKTAGCRASVRYDALGCRERELLGPNRDIWFDCWLPEWTSDLDHSASVLYYTDPDDTPAGGVIFRRGFVEAVTCPAADWLAHADVILAAQPVREVTLTTWPESWGPYNTRPTAQEWLRSRWPPVTTWHLPPAEHAFDIQRLANLIDGR